MKYIKRFEHGESYEPKFNIGDYVRIYNYDSINNKKTYSKPFKISNLDYHDHTYFLKSIDNSDSGRWEEEKN